MKYVIDSSVAFKWFVSEANSDKALLVRADFLNLKCELHAPDVFSVEMAHAFTRAERQGRMTIQAGADSLVDLLDTLPVLHPILPDLLPTAYAISSKMRIGVYDSTICHRGGE